MEDKFLPAKKAKEILGVHTQTLYNWEKNGRLETIRTHNGYRLYNVEKYLKTFGHIEPKEAEVKAAREEGKNLKICYVRVSTLNQRDDLLRQKAYMMEKYKDYEIIEDIGSGINFNRKGLRKIIKHAIAGDIDKLVVAHKDRLTRFGFDLIEDLIKEYSHGEVIVDDKKEVHKEPKDELVEDVLQILNVYTAKLNGLRKYKKIDTLN